MTTDKFIKDATREVNHLNYRIERDTRTVLYHIETALGYIDESNFIQAQDYLISALRDVARLAEYKTEEEALAWAVNQLDEREE